MAGTPILIVAYIKQLPRIFLTLILTYTVLCKLLAGSNLASVPGSLLLNPNIMRWGPWPPTTQHWQLEAVKLYKTYIRSDWTLFIAPFSNIFQHIKAVHSQNINIEFTCFFLASRKQSLITALLHLMSISKEWAPRVAWSAVPWLERLLPAPRSLWGSVSVMKTKPGVLMN